MKKLKKLSEQADLITDNSNGAQAEQIHKLKQMVKKVDMSKKKQETTYVKANRGEPMLESLFLKIDSTPVQNPKVKRDLLPQISACERPLYFPSTVKVVF